MITSLYVFPQLSEARLMAITQEYDLCCARRAQALEVSRTCLRTITKNLYLMLQPCKIIIVQKILPARVKLSINILQTTLQWSSPQTEHISIWTVILKSTTACFGQRKRLENYTRNTCIVKMLSCVRIKSNSKVRIIESFFLLKMSVNRRWLGI